MTLHELKKCLRNANPEVHILANEGDVYLVQVEVDGQQALLMEHNKPLRFRSLSECSHRLAAMGIDSGYMVQTLAYDEMVNSCDGESHCEKLKMHFH